MTPENILFYLLCFATFTVLQSFFINGVNEAFKEDHLFYPVRILLSNTIPVWVQKPLFLCVRCMSSLWGTSTLLPCLIYMYGFHWIEVPVQVFDIFILCSLNHLVYKKV